MNKLKYGNTNTYFINGLLFDTDMPGTMQQLFKALKNNGINLSEIRYVLASHYHPDHIGLVSDLMKTGVKLIVVEHQLSHVHFADVLLGRQSGDRYCPIDEKQAVVIRAEESRLFLESLGIHGEIIQTASHSEDGIALILDDGHCFVGDLEPRQYIEAYEDNPALQNDWATIMKYNPKVIHYGHMPEQIIA